MEKVRRSWLVVPASRKERVESAPTVDADVVVLDLVEFVAEKDKPAAREGMAQAIDSVKNGGAEVFAQVDPELTYADLKACVWPGLTGVVVARLESAAQIAEADALLGQLEEERGLLPGSLEIVASLETARGNQDAYGISTASPRMWGLTLGRAELVMDLRPEPSGEIHLMEYLNQRLITVGRATGRVPLGAWWRYPDRGMLATPENTYQAAMRGRAIGYRGSLCVREDQVGPLNRGFTPTQEEVKAAQALCSSYQQAVDQGKGVMRQDDRIIDRGAVAQGQQVITLAQACAQREEYKAAAKEGRPVPAP